MVQTTTNTPLPFGGGFWTHPPSVIKRGGWVDNIWSTRCRRAPLHTGTFPTPSPFTAHSLSPVLSIGRQGRRWRRKVDGAVQGRAIGQLCIHSNPTSALFLNYICNMFVFLWLYNSSLFLKRYLPKMCISASNIKAYPQAAEAYVQITKHLIFNVFCDEATKTGQIEAYPWVKKEEP